MKYQGKRWDDKEPSLGGKVAARVPVVTAVQSHAGEMDSEPALKFSIIYVNSFFFT